MDVTKQRQRRREIDLERTHKLQREKRKPVTKNDKLILYFLLCSNYPIIAISDLVFPTMVYSRQLLQLFINSRHDFEWLVEGTVGIVFCKLVDFFQDLTTAVSISSLILITIDRFIAVVYPMKHYIMSRRVCKVLIFGTWLVGVGIHAVYFYTIEVMDMIHLARHFLKFTI